MKTIVAEKRCKDCGEVRPSSEFYIAYGNTLASCCKKCHNKRSKNRREVNKESDKEYFKQYQKKNASALKDYHKKWHIRFIDKVREYKRQYYENNKNRVNAWKVQTNRNRRAQKLSGGKFTTRQWLELCKKYGNKCLCCKQEKALTADHVIPLTAGGVNTIDNIQPLCALCNSKKGTKHIDYR